MAGSDARLDAIQDRDKLVIVYDNEPRSKDIVKKIERAIDTNYKVCIWPDNVEHKDINEMVLGGSTPSEVQYMIDQNTYSGLAAKMRLQQWKKI
jgi:hypothetical protein